MADQLTVVILAGGRGTRLQSVVSDRPKPMADVGGRPFLEFVLDDLVSQDLPLRVIMSVGYKADDISGHFGTSYRGIPLQYCVEAHALGTGGAIKKCAADFHLDRPFVVKNGDTYSDGDIGLMWQMFQRHQPDILMSSIHVGDANRFGALDLSPVANEPNLFTVRRFAEKQSSGRRPISILALTLCLRILWRCMRTGSR